MSHSCWHRGGEFAHDWAGVSVSDASGVNGDGVDDMLVGAFAGDRGGLNAGQVYVIFRTKNGGRAEVNLDALAPRDGFIVQGDSAGDFAGMSVSSAGDVNHDGIGDLTIGADASDIGGTNAGRAYVIQGRAGPTRGDI